MSYIIIFFILFCLLIAYRHFLLIKDLTKIREELVEISARKVTNQVLTNPHNFSELTKLLSEFNLTLKNQQKERQNFHLREALAKEQMTNISHDLRTPLASILGYFELLEEPDLPETERAEYLSLIQGRARSLQLLINAYYELARVESDDYQLNLTTVDVNQLLQEMIASYYLEFQAKDLKLVINGIDSNFKQVLDQQMLTRVYTNLIENIIRYAVGDVRIEHVYSAGKYYTKLGNQIPSNLVIESEKVFNRLYVAERERQSNSTGVGLTVVKVILEKLGYRVSCQVIEEWFVITIHWN